MSLIKYVTFRIVTGTCWHALLPAQAIVNYMVAGNPAGYETFGLDTLEAGPPGLSDEAIPIQEIPDGPDTAKANDPKNPPAITGDNDGQTGDEISIAPSNMFPALHSK